MSGDFDRRLTPARPDLAAAHLKDSIEAAAYAEPQLKQVNRAVTGLYADAVEYKGQQTQLLHGEQFRVYEQKNGWVWGQSVLDSYVGYARADCFDAAEASTHRVAQLGTPLFIAPDVKLGARETLPKNAKVTVAESGGRFARLSNALYIFAGHLMPLDQHVTDWVSVAERFAGAPYVWGGKTSVGIDCSGLVQTALEAGGMKSPRDTDMMEKGLGTPVALDAELRRGDLIFWKGHVGIMLDAARLIHANGFWMQVSIEPYRLVVERTIARESLPVRSIRRL